jgi:IS5 family transposase
MLDKNTAKVKHTSQNKNRPLTLDIFRSSFENPDKSNRWVALGDRLPWSGLEKSFNSKLGNS